MNPEKKKLTVCTPDEVLALVLQEHRDNPKRGTVQGGPIIVVYPEAEALRQLSRMIQLCTDRKVSVVIQRVPGGTPSPN
jgi:hypothetical protein